MKLETKTIKNIIFTKEEYRAIIDAKAYLTNALSAAPEDQALQMIIAGFKDMFRRMSWNGKQNIMSLKESGDDA